jgi:hypothetical protein
VNDNRLMHQVAPYPAALASLVERLRYRDHMGWQVWLEDDRIRDPATTHGGESRGLTLVVGRCGPDTYHPEKTLFVNHYFPVPPATFNEASWQRWLFDRLGDVDTHERMEDFALVYEGDPHAAVIRPYKPNHGPGEDPYRVTEVTTETARRTSFRGTLNPE